MISKKRAYDLNKGITQKTILNAINNKTVCCGCLWMYSND